MKRLLCLFFTLFFFLQCSSTSESDVVELTFWHLWGGHEGRFLNELVNEFNETHSHIQVNAVFTPMIGDKLMASIAGRVPPDIATVWNYMFINMGEAGCFLRLNEYMEQAGYSEETYFPGMWEYGMFSESRWGVPASLNIYGIYYNRALIAEAGMDPDDPPQDIETLKKWGEKLTQYNERGQLERVGYLPGNLLIWFLNFGGTLYEPETATLTLDHPNNIKALEWIDGFFEMVGRERWREFAAGFGTYDSPQYPFYQGEIVIAEDGQWQVGMIKEYAPHLDYGVMPFIDVIEGGPGYTRVEGSFWTIPVGTSHPDEAWEFLSWLIAPEQSGRFAAVLRNIPPMREAVEVTEFQEAMENPHFKFFVDMMFEGKAIPFLAIPILNELSLRMIQGVESVYRGAVSPEEFLTRLNRDLQVILDREMEFLGVDYE